MTRATRDGYEVAAGPVRQPLSVASTIARDLGLILLVPTIIVLVVAYVAGDGFETAPKRPACVDPSACADDAPRSEEP